MIEFGGDPVSFTNAMVTLGGRKRQKCADDEYRESLSGRKPAIELVDDGSESYEPLDDLLPDIIFSESSDSKRAKKQKDKEVMSHLRRTSTGLSEIDLNDDEEQFIYNLPDDEKEIKSMLRETRTQIAALYKQL